MSIFLCAVSDHDTVYIVKSSFLYRFFIVFFIVFLVSIVGAILFNCTLILKNSLNLMWFLFCYSGKYHLYLFRFLAILTLGYSGYVIYIKKKQQHKFLSNVIALELCIFMSIMNISFESQSSIYKWAQRNMHVRCFVLWNTVV